MAHVRFHPGQPPYAGMWHSWHNFANALWLTCGGLAGPADDTWYASAIHCTREIRCPNISRVKCQCCQKVEQWLLHMSKRIEDFGLPASGYPLINEKTSCQGEGKEKEDPLVSFQPTPVLLDT